MASTVNHVESSVRGGLGLARPLTLHADRFFDSDPAIRRVARELYDEIRTLPLVCPHGHVDPALLADNAAFPEPTALLIIPDHYVFRMLYSRGVRLEDLGVPTRDGTAVERDPRNMWKLMDLGAQAPSDVVAISQQILAAVEEALGARRVDDVTLLAIMATDEAVRVR